MIVKNEKFVLEAWKLPLCRALDFDIQIHNCEEQSFSTIQLSEKSGIQAYFWDLVS